MGAVTVFVRGQGGSIFEMDVPSEGSAARETWDARVDKGELTIVPEAEWVDRGDGTSYLVVKTKRAAPAATAGDRAPTKKELVAALTELDVEIDPAWKTNADLAGALEWTLATIEDDDASHDGE